MSYLLPLLILIAGFVLLIKGADWLVEGASSIAKRFRVSDLVIGLTIVAFGTSAPELIVNIIASIEGNADIAIGNVVGSNISNTLLILGCCALIAPLAVQRNTVLKEIPFGLLAAGTLFVMANDALIDGYDVSELSRSDGVAFIGFFILFMYYTFGLNGANKEDSTHSEDTVPVWLSAGKLLIGLVALVGGGKIAVNSAVEIATLFGLSEALIGLTIVALGTSLPELAASGVATYRGRTDIAIGNIVGSNIFNIFWVLGLSAIIKPIPFAPATNIDLGVVVIATALLFLLVHNGHVHHRILWWRNKKKYAIHSWEGIILLLGYVSYIVYIGLRG